MKKIYALILTLILFSTGYSEAAVGTVSPPSISVTKGVPSTATLVYRLSDVAATNCEYRSSKGSFIGGTSPLLEENPVALTVVIPSTINSGSATETLRVSAGLIEKALRRDIRTFTYTRVFESVTCDDIAVTMNVTITVKGEASAEFGITRMELYFENRRPEITIGRNTPDLKAFADVRFAGSGLLEGYWEVDGRLISREFRHLIYGRSVTLQSPQVPGLPTFDEGSHVVRFVITKPVSDIATPFIVYFVTPKEMKVRQAPLLLLVPVEGGSAKAETKFSWEKPEGANIFLISFYEDRGGTPIFSAYTREPFYSLPGPVASRVFTAERQYFWKVVGFDAENQETSESDKRAFIIN
ncbi:MAG: hypothetical protein C4560_11125 [Nitrospiraceae bacterium]|nr:MAG: hypothetical protein C4560_11125 [Nitrospiraceae bacterium]